MIRPAPRLLQLVEMKALPRLFLIALAVFFGSFQSFSQAPSDTGPSVVAKDAADSKSAVGPAGTPSPAPNNNYIKDLVLDQKKILLSPAHIGRSDLKWLVPLAATTAVLLATDRKTSSWVSPNGTLNGISREVGRGGNVFVASGFASGLYLIGRATNHPRAEQTGKLAFEALVGTSVVIAVLKNVAGRARPNLESGRGRFFAEGRSFPSGHASDAWAVATVVAYEYRKQPLIKYAAIASAIAISLSRYSGRAHFMSEVWVGSAIGFGIGRFVYMSRH
jgi:membrane-associated phospholipid phosphatase